MYVGVDVGGTKTLLAVLNEHGEIREEKKFPTPKNYQHFLLELKNAVHHLEHQDFKAGAVGMPVTVYDRHNEIGRLFSNLPWKNVHMQRDVEQIMKCPIAVNNDAKLAALSEAMLIKDKYHRVLYVTVSTGIGIGLVTEGQIDQNIGDGGGRAIMLEYKDKIMPWEDFAGGRAIVQIYGKKAEDIHDSVVWTKICRELAKGFIHLVAITQPEVIVIGGSVGTYYERYGKILEKEMQKYGMPMVKLPDFVQAGRPEKAVVYGCYDLAKQKFGHANSTK
jgi:glucokinase